GGGRGKLWGARVPALGAGVGGATGATAGINVGDGIRIYEAFHGGTRQEIGVDRANPLPLLLPAIDLLEGVGLKEPAQRIFEAIGKMLSERRVLTPDLGGGSSTTEMTDAMLAALAA